VANYLPPVFAWGLLVAITLLAQLEFYTMANRAGFAVFRGVGLVCGAAMITATFWTTGPEAHDLASGYKWENLILFATLLAMFMRQFPQKHNTQPVATIAVSLLGVWYVPFLFNYFTRLAFGWEGAVGATRVSPTGRWLILYLVAVVKSSDIGAYFSGRALGRHKLFPRLSPKKTWEGFVGGLLAAVVVSLLFHAGLGGKLGRVAFGRVDAVLLGFVLALAGVCGDLFESLIKRASATKDSGRLIPGMGGLLDVLDSLLFGAPMLYAYAKLFLE
jgi:phosphatidate cytidylyltransferase